MFWDWHWVPIGWNFRWNHPISEILKLKLLFWCRGWQNYKCTFSAMIVPIYRNFCFKIYHSFLGYSETYWSRKYRVCLYCPFMSQFPKTNFSWTALSEEVLIKTNSSTNFWGYSLSKFSPISHPVYPSKAEISVIIVSALKMPKVRPKLCFKTFCYFARKFAIACSIQRKNRKYGAIFC